MPRSCEPTTSNERPWPICATVDLASVLPRARANRLSSAASVDWSSGERKEG